MARIAADDVFASVASMMSRPFVWGPADCCTAVCDVFFRLHGFDPMAPARPLYSDAISAMRLVKSHGGMAGLLDHFAVRAGLVPGHAIGGISLSADENSLLICIEPGLWAGKTLTGFALMRQASRGYHAQASFDHDRAGRFLDP